MHSPELPPGQQLVAAGKWPVVGERVPRSTDEPWSVQVSGAVSRPLAIMIEELQAWPSVERSIDIHCVTRWSKLAVRFTGAPLAAIIERA